MGNHLGVILEVLAVGEALPGAIENTVLVLARLRRDAGKSHLSSTEEAGTELRINGMGVRGGRRFHWQISAMLTAIANVGARPIQPAAAHPASHHTILGTIRRAFTNPRRREPTAHETTVHETVITDEAVRELAQWFQQQYDMEAFIDEETAGWAEEREVV